MAQLTSHLQATYARYHLPISLTEFALIRFGATATFPTPSPDIEVAGEAGDGTTPVSMTSALRPDVVLMDVRMPGCDGIQATRDIADAGLPSKVLILTTFDLDDYIYAGLRAGAPAARPGLRRS